MKKYFNNKGLTLVELLAAIALIGIISTIAGSLVTQTFQSNSIVQNEIDLKQQTNSIITTIREKVIQQDTTICLVDRETLSMENEDLLTKEHMTISELYIENIKNSPNSNDTLDITSDETLSGNDCIITDGSPTKVMLKTDVNAEENDQSYQTSTIIQKRKTEPELALPEEENDGDEGDPELKLFTTWEEFETIEQDRESDFKQDHPNGDRNYCEFDENILLNASQVFAPSWGYKCHITTFHQSLWSKTSMTLNRNYNDRTPLKVLVGNHFYLDQSAKLEQDSILDISGNGLFEGNVVLSSSSQVRTFNAYYKQGLTLQSDSKVETNGSIRMDESSTLQSNSQLFVKGYAFLRDTFTMQSNSTMNVDHNLDGDSLFLQSNSKLDVKGNIQINGNLKMQSDSRFSITGDTAIGNVDQQSNSRLDVAGDTLVNESLYVQNNAVFSSGSLTVNGPLSMQSNAMVYSEGDIVLNGKVSTQNGTVISSRGDIHINDQVGPGWSKAIICAEGEVYGAENISSNHKVRSNHGHCPTP
ncbi:pilus assembly FimT family protein [Halobacillus salinus]|uniref:Type II secretion system protein n=1 Tax=Halobacillus salinus TaxID=192814 RepID=A0A4Z0H171_9BACI|nr:type II secretion system protein [Halobacillus salinus]TGB04153.1 type II secretion system protein [Halobacillus salinus]